MKNSERAAVVSGERGTISRSWDDEYRRGRYRDEPPIPFAGRIVEVLRDRPDAALGKGLYVGCGNGRNYVPLVEAGLDLIGLDSSAEALRQLAAGHPRVAPKLVRADFLDFGAERLFDYIVAIQVFQHGNGETVRAMFAHAAELLKNGGMLFVRVNSASTKVDHAHRVVERDDEGGFTVRYDEGPKAGLAVHFLSRPGLEDMVEPWFEVLAPATEETIRREAPGHGSWAQWEGIYTRRRRTDRKEAIPR